MKHIIYTPANDELIPENSVNTKYDNQNAISSLVEDDFVTSGVIYYENNNNVILNGYSLLVEHLYAGWEVHGL